MNRLPLSDELPYAFVEPRATPFWTAIARLYARRYYLPGPMRVARVEVDGLDPLKGLVAGGDGVLIAPNHPDHADPSVLLDVGRQAGLPLHFMAAYQICQGNGRLARWVFPRMGVFPVDREGVDLRAFKTGVEILATARAPLVVFPEGEVYHVCDRLTPIREGAAALATTAARRAAERGKTVWIVPAAIKYRFLDGTEPLPALSDAMTRLESRFTWHPRSDHPLIERVYAFGEALIGLKETEYLGAPRPGPLKPRIGLLRDAILDALDLRHFGKPRAETPPVRVKEIRHACLEALADPTTTPDRVKSLRHDLHDAFVAIQLFSYPGDYLRSGATLERLAETLMKFEQDVLGEEHPLAVAPRRALVKFGPPIDVRAALASHPRPRQAAAAITHDLETQIQSLLDALGPGRPIALPTLSDPPIPPRLSPTAQPAEPIKVG